MSEAALKRARGLGPDYRVLGSLLKEETLLNYVLEHRLGTNKDDWQKRCAIHSAAEQILESQKIYSYLIAGVMVKGGVRRCAAIASEDYDDHMPIPSRETFEKLKKMMATDKEPRWFIHVYVGPSNQGLIVTKLRSTFESRHVLQYDEKARISLKHSGLRKTEL
ncbi:hypothetical protein C8R44DRAFT_983187, partial [Mycena epipterygia]